MGCAEAGKLTCSYIFSISVIDEQIKMNVEKMKAEEAKFEYFDCVENESDRVLAGLEWCDECDICRNGVQGLGRCGLIVEGK